MFLPYIYITKNILNKNIKSVLFTVSASQLADTACQLLPDSTGVASVPEKSGLC